MQNILKNISAQLTQHADAPVSAKESVIFIVVVTGLMFAAFSLRLEYPAFLLVFALLGAVLVMQHSMAWIITSIALFLPVFWHIEAGLTPGEILHTMVYYGGLLWWFFHRIIVARERLLWSAGALLTLLLVVQMLLLAPVSIGLGAEPYVWLRELVVLSTALMLFPISHECVTRKRQYAVGGTMIAALFLLSLKNIWQYKQRVLDAVWLWQVGASRASDTFFLIFVLAVVGFALLLSARKPLGILASAAVFAVGVAATVLSFYRTIWVAALLAWAGILFMEGRRIWRRAFTYMGAVLLVAGISWPIFLADVISIEILWRSISHRFVSIGAYKRDVSITNRERETETILADVQGYVLFGKGLAVTTPFTKLTSLTTIHPTWTHNGYAWALKHYGIIGSLLIFAAWLYYIAIGVRIMRLLRRSASPDDDDAFRIRLLAGAAAGIIAATFLVSITINQFLSHEAGFVFAVTFGLLEVWHREALHRARGTA